MDNKSDYYLDIFQDTIDLEYFNENGKVSRVIDEIIFVKGLEKGCLYELVLINESTAGIILSLGIHEVGVGVLEKGVEIGEGMEVRLTGEFSRISVPEFPGGKVLDVLGNIIFSTKKEDGQQENTFSKVKAQHFNIARPIMHINSVNRSLETGTMAIDSMIPIGRGQRQLILGNRQTGKTQLALNTIINQRGKAVHCIYVAIGQKNVQVTNVMNQLKDANAFEYTTIVSCSAGESMVAQYLAPYAGVALAEVLRDQGKDVLIVYDDLSKHADTYRTISLLFERAPGREAYPGDTFYIHSSLLERAGQLNSEQGGGSITALPIIETLADDVSAYIPSNVISITDGQIFLRSNLFASGQKPAIDVGISVSRVGSSAQKNLVKNSSKGLSLVLSQYTELKELMLFDSDMDEKNINMVRKGEILLNLFKQDADELFSRDELALLLIAFQNNYFAHFPAEKIKDFKTALSLALKKEERVNQVLKKSVDSEKLTEDQEKLLKTFVEDVKAALN